MATQTPGQTITSDEGDPVLVGRIREEIGVAPGGRITFARFMEMALTEPGLGYYATSIDRPTRDGDFLTAPELHPFFGRCIGRLLTDVWTRMDSPRPFVVREWGAGRGTLARSAADGLAVDGSGLSTVIDWQPLDIPGRHPDGDAQRIIGAVIANEYLDALPVHRLVRRGDRIRERYVTWIDGRFAEVEGDLSSETLRSPLDIAGIALAEGQSAEVRPAAEAWLRLVAEQLERGVVLVIDYGHSTAELYSPSRIDGTLATYRDHVVGGDPFSAVGRQDVTAHVDIGALKRTAHTLGLDVLGSTRQARLLVRLGLGDMLSELGRDPTTHPSTYVAARASVSRLLDPRHLGGFKVLAFGRGLRAVPPLLGLDDDPEA